VDVALQAPSLFVLRRDESLTRGAQVLDETRVPEHEPSLRREVTYELLLGRVSGSEAGLWTPIAPSISPWWRTGNDRIRLPCRARATRLS
jgi:hypothetical protein